MIERDDFLAAMRAAPQDPLPMMVFADWLQEQGDDARAECLRWLGELRLVGSDRYGYSHHTRDSPWPNNESELRDQICTEWFDRAISPLAGWEDGTNYYGLIENRMAMADAYAEATPETRARWLAETLAMYTSEATA